MSAQVPLPETLRVRRFPWGEIAAGIFLFLVLGVIAFPFLLSQKGSRSSPVLSNIKRADLGILMFENEHHGSAPEMGGIALYQAMVLPYVGDQTIFNDPDTGRPFVPNSLLSYVNLDKLSKPATTVLLYDDKVQYGKRLVAFADGNGRPVPEAEFEKDLLHTPRLLRSIGLLVGDWSLPSGHLLVSEDGTAVFQGEDHRTYPGTAVIDKDGYLKAYFGNKAPMIYRKLDWVSVYKATLLRSQRLGGVQSPLLP